MHETSIVNSIMRTLEMEFDEEQLDKMKAIHLKVGVLSNIEPRLLHNAYSAFNHCGSKYHNVDLHIESTDIKVFCKDCDKESNIYNYKFKCDYCHKPNKNIIQGEEMLIHKIEFED